MSNVDRWVMMLSLVDWAPTLAIVICSAVIALGVWRAQKYDKERYECASNKQNFRSLFHMLLMWTWVVPAIGKKFFGRQHEAK